MSPQCVCMLFVNESTLLSDRQWWCTCTCRSAKLDQQIRGVLMDVDAGAAAAIAAISAQRRIDDRLALFVTDIHLCAMIHQILHRETPAPERGRVKWSLAIRRRGIYIGSGLDERFN